MLGSELLPKRPWEMRRSSTKGTGPASFVSKSCYRSMGMTGDPVGHRAVSFKKTNFPPKKNHLRKDGQIEKDRQDVGSHQGAHPCCLRQEILCRIVSPT
jgi:hypothetical protein